MTIEGNVVLEIEGQYGLRGSTWALKKIGSALNSPGLVSLYGKLFPTNNDIDIDTIIVTYRELLNEYFRFSKIDRTVSDDEAADVIDKLGGVVASCAPLIEALKQFMPKNLEAPQMAG
jgi:hypothetical protein